MSLSTVEPIHAVSVSHLLEAEANELVDDVEEIWDSPQSAASGDELSCISIDSPTFTATTSDLDLARSSTPWSLSLPWVPGGSLEENDLFYHYISALAPVMTPIDDEHNPWNSTYPRLAIQWQTSPAACSLLHAILAQSAFQRANLSQASSSKYLRVGTRNYVLALRHLRHSLDSPTEDFSTNLAAMLTVTIAGHCFEGQSAGLTHHVEGAIQYVKQHLARRPWTVSHDAWVITQSFVLHGLISRTTKVDRSDAVASRASNRKKYNFQDTLDEVIADVMANPTFAYTVGSTPHFMKALYQARQLESELSGSQGPPQGRLSIAQLVQVSNILADLNAPMEPDIELYLSRQQERWIQQPSCEPTCTLEERWRYIIAKNLCLFKSGIEIYLFRVVLQYPPSAVAPQVLSTLQTAAELLEPLDRAASVSIWPIFIAAVEAYEPVAQDLADAALQVCSSLGAVNRKTAHDIVKTVWARREGIAAERDCHVGDVQLDWRDVLADLNIDILLL
ncbi:uncharacterized protein AB675_1039 [Cyphellophora attinorum]|uniref:Uncharacterized protein n=1 Tax=Cyphellophora attinorum TaxID=1664694 RepID=A0A0N1NY56_9EURO|nr:uncharacterized protein AB675_1039 [Phialophora attinorum]KPI38154.1 hypothetical protein AB675_1039 [Phialophora attinorum]